MGDVFISYEKEVVVEKENFMVNGGYRWGYNTQERVDEVSGKGNHYTAEFWQYDPRLGRRWNIDPMSFKYPWQSPYVAFNNNPIFYNDPLGLEGEEPKDGDTRVENGRNEVYVDGSWGYDASGGEEVEVVGKESNSIDRKLKEIESTLKPDRLSKDNYRNPFVISQGVKYVNNYLWGNKLISDDATDSDASAIDGNSTGSIDVTGLNTLRPGTPLSDLFDLFNLLLPKNNQSSNTNERPNYVMEIGIDADTIYEITGRGKVLRVDSSYLNPITNEIRKNTDHRIIITVDGDTVIIESMIKKGPKKIYE